MKNYSVLNLMAAMAISAATGSVLAEPRAPRVVDPGKLEFESQCASCHGVNGKGNGTVTPWLTKAPPDLTTLAKSNGGILPMERLYKSISGESVPAHGSRDMPVWGQAYRVKAAEYYMDYPYDAEAYVRARILSLLDFINRIQVK